MCRFMSLTTMDDPDLILDLTLMHCDRPGELSWTCERLYNAERKGVADLKALQNLREYYSAPLASSACILSHGVHPVPVPLSQRLCGRLAVPKAL